MTAAPATSPTTELAAAFVAADRARAEALGRALAERSGDPSACAAAVRASLMSLADPDDLAGQRRVAPGIGTLHGVRSSLLDALARGFRAETRHDPAMPLLDIAQHLLREPELEAHWFAFGVLERTIAREPERTWQLLRGAAAGAGDWITVDRLARAYGRGILTEPFRWAELEQLVYSPSRWERRLVGSTIATIPHLDHRMGRSPDTVRHGLELIGQLIGDHEPDVRRALARALRTLGDLDGPATAAFLASETDQAVRTADGHRARVIRAALPRLAPTVAAELRARLDGIRVRAGAPSTSLASRTRAAFVGLGLDVPPAARPIVSRP